MAPGRLRSRARTRAARAPRGARSTSSARARRRSWRAGSRAWLQGGEHAGALGFEVRGARDRLAELVVHELAEALAQTLERDQHGEAAGARFRRERLVFPGRRLDDEVRLERAEQRAAPALLGLVAQARERARQHLDRETALEHLV